MCSSPYQPHILPDEVPHEAGLVGYKELAKAGAACFDMPFWALLTSLSDLLETR